MTGLVPNARSRRIEASATLAITAEAARLKAEGHDVVSLGAGEPDFPTPEPIARAGIEAIEQHNYRYTAAAGTPALRKAGAAWLGEEFGLARGYQTLWRATDLEDVEGWLDEHAEVEWTSSGGDMSAIAYAFAYALHRELDAAKEAIAEHDIDFTWSLIGDDEPD